MKKIIIIILIIIFVAFLLLRDGSDEVVNTVSTDEVTTVNDTAGQESDATTSQDRAEAPTDTSGIVIVSYSKKGFEPKTVTISAGQTVRFVNEGASNMWVGSDEHPTHINYSSTRLGDHCPDTDGTAFDQCESGDEYEFTFTKTGEWGYHNHVNPINSGTVIVK